MIFKRKKRCIHDYEFNEFYKEGATDLMVHVYKCKLCGKTIKKIAF